jgi:hypothetical protein
MKMHGQHKKINSKNTIIMCLKLTHQCIIDHWRIEIGKFLYLKYREQKYNQTFQYLSFAYQKTSELNSTHPWIGAKI